jgi:leucyl aminopeptidase
MTLKLIQNASNLDESAAKSIQHVVFVLPENEPTSLPYAQFFKSKLHRSKKSYQDLAKSPITLDLPTGGLASYVILNGKLTSFQRHQLLRKAAKPMLDEQPAEIAIDIHGEADQREINACAAYYVISANAQKMPVHKKTADDHQLGTIHIYGFKAAHDYAYVNARVAGNALCRQLTMLPPNQLTPTLYRAKIADLAKHNNWELHEYDMEALKKMGAGAFVAVGQGSQPQDAAIVHLSYQGNEVKKHFAIVGKGICFDTGGHNLKPAKYMLGMHEDMNGSAVALGLLLAASQLQLPIKIDCWLAIAQNHISPAAYKQNDVVTALNGTHIEIVHTDAEGRMVLADTLTLASREKPDYIIDFATLTGSMISALGDRMSGIITNNPALACKAVGAGYKAGERVVAFPLEEDYDTDLESDIADIKQCTLEGGADHIHAARFLSKFIEGDIPWLHTDLSSANRKGGLGAIDTDTNGFGVGFGLEMIKQLTDEPLVT